MVPAVRLEVLGLRRRHGGRQLLVVGLDRVRVGRRRRYQRLSQQRSVLAEVHEVPR